MHAAVLRYVENVARFGSIRRAAEVLHVAASAVNRQIIKLEAEIGVPLFERRQNGMHLTPAGEHLVRHIQATLADWESTQNRIAELGGDIHGETNILAIPAFLVDLVPAALATTFGQHPHIRFKVKDGSPPEITKEMREGKPDLALLFMDARYNSYDLLETLDTHVGAVMRSDHPLAKEAEVSMSDCAAFPIVSLSDPWIIDMLSELEFAHSGASLQTSVMSNSFRILTKSIRSGLGIGFTTPIGVLKELMSGELVHVPFKGDRTGGATALFAHKQRKDAAHIRVVARNIQSRLADLRESLLQIQGRGRG